MTAKVKKTQGGRAQASGKGEPEVGKQSQDRVYRRSSAKFERVSPERFAGAEAQILELLGKNFKDARRRAGYTQQDVADIIHSSQPFVGAVERGEHNIRLTTLVRLAYAVHTDPGALLLGQRANHHSLETLVRLIGALYAHLEAEVGDRAKDLPDGEVLTLISASPFRFDVEGRAGGDRPVAKKVPRK